MGQLLIRSLHLLLPISLFPHFSSPWNWISSGKLSTPGDVTFFFVGENLTVLCHKYSDFTGNVRFKINNDDDLPAEFVKQLNTTHAMLVKPVLPDSPEGLNVQCFDNTGLINSLQLMADYAPSNATNLTVEWLNKNDLNFGFDFWGIPYKNKRPDVLNITAEYARNNDTDWLSCPNNVTLDNLRCSVASFISGEETMFYVRVNATNICRRMTVTTILGNKPMKEYAKPSSVVLQKLAPLNSSSVQLSVTFDVSGDWNRLNYIITYYRDGQSDPVINKTETGQTTDKTFTLSGLHPAYTYRVEVQATFETGYPSDLGSKSFSKVTMPEDAPAAGPWIHPSAFSWPQTSCVNQSEVYIYYEGVPDEYKNGEIMNYTASLSTASQQTSVQTKPEIHTIKLENVPCDKGLEVKVQAATNAGNSPHTSLSLPSYNSTLINEVRERDLKIRFDKDSGAVTALWNIGSANWKHVVYYCEEDGLVLAQCKSSIRFIEIEPGEKISQVLLPNATVNMKFGMAVLSPEPSGIVFTECVYDTSASPDLGKANLEAKSLSNHISITWSWQRCRIDRRTMVLEYHLEICRLTGTKDCSNHIVDGDAREYNIVNPVRDANYSVRIRANTTSTDTWTEYSDFVYASLPSAPGIAALTGGEIAGIVIAVLLGVLCLGATLAFIVRHNIKQKEAKFSPSIFNSSDYSTEESKPEKLTKVNNNESVLAIDSSSTKDNANLLSPDSILHQLPSLEGYENSVDPLKYDLPPGYSRLIADDSAPVIADYSAPAAGTQHITEIIVSHAQPVDCNAPASRILPDSLTADSAKCSKSSSTACSLQDLSTTDDKDINSSSSAPNKDVLPSYIVVTTNNSPDSDAGSNGSSFEEMPYSQESTEVETAISSAESSGDASFEEPVASHLIPTKKGYVSYSPTPTASVASAAANLEKSSLPKGLPDHEAKISSQGEDFVAEFLEKHKGVGSGPINQVNYFSDSAASHGIVLPEAASEDAGPFLSAEQDNDQHSLCSSKSSESSAGISSGSFASAETSGSDAGSNQDPGDRNVGTLALDRQDSGYISPHPASELQWDLVRRQTAASDPTNSMAATPKESTRAGNGGGYIGLNDLPSSIVHTLGDAQSIA